MPWYHMNEIIPETSGDYIVAGRKKYSYEDNYTYFVDLAYYYSDIDVWETFNDWYEGEDEYEITQWMPLPEHPMNKKE